ncbi:MAG: ATP-dependent Clp protease ATP-binding subunit ClpA [Desulfovibrionaceae bacterium]|nr:ATP-dependent Clp protease ATP-binding subunit ClpA [Desulfovibrionaceae bacterium]
MFSRDLQSIFQYAVNVVHRHRHELLTVEHILYAITFNEKGNTILEAIGADIAKLQEQLNEFFAKELTSVEQDIPTEEVVESLLVQRIVKRTIDDVQFQGRDTLDVGDFLVSIMKEDCYATYYIRLQGIDQEDLIQYLEENEKRVIVRESASEDDADGQESNTQKGKKKSLLALYTVELTEKARNGKLDPLIGREMELDRTIEILCRRRKNNPLFVGEPGVGKTAMVEGLAQRIANGQVPPMFAKTRVYSLDMGTLLAGTKYRGDFESRLKGILLAIKKIPDAILFIDEIHTLVGAGAVSGGSIDAANMLKPALASGEIRCIGSTTYEEFRNKLEKDRALARRFQKIDLHEPKTEDCIAILEGVKDRYASFHNVDYSKAVLSAIVDLSQRHIKDRLLPDKAIDVMDEVGAQVHIRQCLEKKENSDPVAITISDVEHVIARTAGIPERSVSSQEEERLATLETDLLAKVFGQDEAIRTVVKAILRSRAGLSIENRPTGSFLFYGPTGVGKTEVARTLAACMGIEFLRFDMSEYMEKHSVSRLVGTPPGYVGFDQGGLLTEAVRKAPYSVVLLDELEKAHPDIFNILLQVMDYGTLTDNTGRKTDFSHVVLIMTSNAGAFEMSKRTVGFGTTGSEDVAQKALRAVEQLFTPEFRNRLDALVPFHSLTSDIMLSIVDKFLKDLESHLRSRKVTLTLGDDARNWLATKGYDPAMGARPLRRLIRERIEDSLAEALLFGDLKKGGTATYYVDHDTLLFHFEAKEAGIKKRTRKKKTESAEHMAQE